MGALAHMIVVVGVILAVWTVVPGAVLVVTIRVWQRYYERTDSVSMSLITVSFQLDSNSDHVAFPDQGLF